MSSAAGNQFHIQPLDDRLAMRSDADQWIRLYSQQFFGALQSVPSPRCIDLLRIAAGVYGIDRTVRRSGCKGRHNANGVRTLCLIFDVLDYPFWRNSQAKVLIEEILTFLTDENWEIKFERAPCIGIGYQGFLNLPGAPTPERLALYSGGLDSAAGLANQLQRTGARYALVTVGHQPGLRKRAARHMAALVELAGFSVPRHVSLVTNLRGGVARRADMQELSQRSRAFLFCVTAAVAAREFGIRSIEVFENGVGAVNCPLTAATLRTGLATRGAHPTFLRLMSVLGSLVADFDLRFELPFRDQTKGEMLSSLAGKGLDVWLQRSHSCIHTSLCIKGVRHCGECPACIERRQAFAVAGIREDKSDYRVDLLAGHNGDHSRSDYYRLFRTEADAWLGHDVRTRRRMADHLRITGIASRDIQRIHQLYDRHATEVRRVFPGRLHAAQVPQYGGEQASLETGVGS